MERTLLWKRDILGDPKFDALSDQDRVKVATNYFERYVNTEDFRQQPEETQTKVKGNLFSSLQREAPFKAKHPGLYAAGMTVAGLPASIGEFGRSVASGATAGITDWIGRKGTELGTSLVPGTDYDERADGTRKGPGFLGELELADGTVATELSIGVDFGQGEQEIPLLVPTLTPQEVEAIRTGQVNEELFKVISDKAIAHAQERTSKGKSPFLSESEKQIRPMIERYFGEDVVPIPGYMQTAGHMLGMFAPIGAAHQGINWLVKGVKSLVPSSKWAGTLARSSLWGVGGAGYHTVERATAGIETTAGDVALDAGLWAGIEAIAQSIGWGGRIAIGANRLAKATGLTRSEALDFIMLHARKDGVPIVEFARAYGPDYVKEHARFVRTMSEARAHNEARRQAAEQIAREANVSLDEAYRRLPVESSLEKSGAIPPLQEAEATKQFYYELDKLINGKVGTYQDLVNKMGAPAAAARARAELENLRLIQMKIGEESARPKILTGTTLSSKEADALAMQIIEIQRKPSFLWTAEEKLIMQDFLHTDRVAIPPPGVKPDLLPPPEPVVSGVGEKSIIDRQVVGMGPRTAEVEARLVEPPAPAKKVRKRKPKTAPKAEPKVEPIPEIVTIPDELKTPAQIAAEGKRYGLTFQGLKELPEQVPQAEFFDPVTRKVFVKETNETVGDALTKHRLANKAEPPGPPSDLPEKFPALRIDGKVYVAKTPDGTNHSMIFESLPEGAVKNGKKIESGWATATGENFSKNMYGAVAGLEVDEDGTLGINPELAAIGMIGGRALTTRQGIEIFQSKFRAVLDAAKHIPKAPLQSIERYLWKKGVTKDETAYLLSGLRDRKVISREEILEEVALRSGQFREVKLFPGEAAEQALKPGEVFHGKTRYDMYTEGGPTVAGSYREVFVTYKSGVPVTPESISDKVAQSQVMTGFKRIIDAVPEDKQAIRRQLTEVYEGVQASLLSQPDLNVSIAISDNLSVRANNYLSHNATDFYYKVQLDAIKAARKSKQLKLPWKDGHGMYEEIANPIVRIRYNIRETSDGRRVLFVEEMQGPSPTNQRHMPDWIKDRIYDIGTKRAISIAKEEGLDGVAITTGAMQAERYNLRRHLDAVIWEPAKEGVTAREAMVKVDQIAVPFSDTTLQAMPPQSRLITLVTSGSGEQVGIITNAKNEIVAAHDGRWVGKQLDEVVGKELATKILRSPKGQLAEEGLEIGGEGLRNLYDNRIVGLLSKYAKEPSGEAKLLFGSDTLYPRTAVPFVPVTDKAPLTYNMYSTAGGLSGFNFDEEANVTFDPYIAAAGIFGGFGAGRFLRRTPRRAPERPDGPGKAVAEMFDRTEQQIADIVKTRWEPWKDWLMKAWVDSKWLAKRWAREFNPELGRELAEVSNAIGGVNSRTRLQYQAFEGKIYNHLSNRELEVLDRVINAERAVAIRGYKPDYVLQEGKSVEQFKQYLLNLKEAEGLTDVQIARIKDASNEFFKAELDILKQYREAGIISAKDFENMSRFRYSPRVQLDQLAALDHKISGRTLDLSRTGLADLGGGAEGLVDIRSKQLLHHNVMKANFIGAKARANNTLLKLADDMAEAHTTGTFKDTPWIRRAQPEMRDGKIVRDASGNVVFEKPGLNEEAIHTMIDGKQVKMIAHIDFANSWLGADTASMEMGVKFMRWASMTQAVKPVATGINPAFIIANIPMDVGTVLTGKQYSSFLPLASAQMVRDMKTVAMDVVKRKGRYHDFINEYGGMEFLSLYGRIGKEDSTMAAVESVLGWAGLTSELLVRLAHRERSIINYTKDFVKKHGRQPVESEMKDIQFRATQWARDHGPDYAQAGNIAKVFDQAAPYFNATIQANRVLVQNVYENPARFAFHLAQLWTVGAGIYAWNTSINPEAYDQVSPFDKSINWVICLPDAPGYTSYMDKDNQVRHRYIKIRKVPGLMPLHTAMDSLLEYVDKGTIPSQQAWEAMEYQLPPFMPPSIAAISALAANADTHFWTAVWQGPARIEEYRKFNPGKTEKVFINVAHHLNQTIGLDLGPAQLEAAFHKIIPASNPIVTSGVSLANLAATALDGPHTIEPASKTWDEKLSADPTIRRIVGTTHPIHSAERQQAYDTITAVKGERAEQYMRMNELTDEYLRNRNQGNLMKVRDYIYSQPQRDWERLDKQFMDSYDLRDLPDRGYWVTLQRAPVEARAKILFDRVISLPSDERQAFVDLANAIPGLVTPAVLEMWEELVEDYTPPRR